MNENPVTIIVTGRNSETTIRDCLRSLIGQDYPVDRIIVFDNGSSDGSVDIVRQAAAQSRVPVELVEAGPKGTISTSYNRGVRLAKTEIVVVCHSDCVVPTSGELRKLVAPFGDSSVLAANPVMDMPRDVWLKFPFWQKVLFVNFVDRPMRSICAMFDAYRKSAYLQVGGFDEVRFTSACGFGGEDSDMAWRISKLGKTADTEAQVHHVHARSPQFSFESFLGTRAMLGRTYGKILQRQKVVCEFSNLLLLVRPALMLLPFLMIPIGVVPVLSALALQLLFGMAYARRAFLCREVWSDARVLVLPLVQWMMVYWEGFWFCHGLLTPPKK